MGTSVLIRVDLDGGCDGPRVSVRQEDAGPVVFLTMPLDHGDRVAICLRTRAQAEALRAAVRKAVEAFSA